ncbi:DNA helicase/exodeoxyribonuclease V, subunit A [Paenibacillus sp. 1_12]|uniref:helicase-exonuclease AddAB subunit AddA n=1 Tax=Paenibacillus sp. 1_12 TaxID=1566278 RepID=UPI0008F0C590|nr:helicase-exonuclease AddAB subunit AddA [Paenibacillus sp. 1_12]SFL33061.1 DNA helicase/exodeoxyribonuclease V, subunit A [Paenibacillus sp. 1_12]
MINKTEKPEGTSWTEDQWDAISIHGHDMLVAAAAGSGKTAVLVERIIRRISSEQEPVDVDRLLVATFTNAAAAEMRHRISEALEKELERNPGSDHVRRQLALMGRASITTLHSFCLEVIRTHYQQVGLDPGFRIANETESDLMRQDLIEELFEEQYGSSTEDSDFWKLAEWFSGEKTDDALYRLVQKLYDDSRSHPWPAMWLRETAAMFDRDADTPNPWIPGLLASVQMELEGITAMLQEAVQLAEQPGGPSPYLVNLQEDMETVAYLQQVADYSWDHLYESFQGASFGKLKPCKGSDYDKLLQEQVKDLRNKAKDQLSDLTEELFGRTTEQYEEELLVLAPLMSALVELVIEFGNRYQTAKQAKGLVDFGDLEHFCLQLLSDVDPVNGKMGPSEIAKGYRDRYVEVLLDEYQDTNRVQETIVAFISREMPGNRFMVGDVKQSIYRFRLAEPGLFLDKYKNYPSDDTVPGQRIDLARNFRSRTSVVNGVNYIFKHIMGEAVGEISYDDRAELKHGADYYPQWNSETNGSEAIELLLIDRSEDLEASKTSEEVEQETGSSDQGSDGLSDGYDADAGMDLAAEAREMETVQLEARMIAAQIHKLLGETGEGTFQVFDKSTKGQRDVTYRDIVILLRATQQWSPVLIEELRQQGIPAYAELNTGYFSAMEVEVVLSLLKVIDNPFQDIPLASVLRSPIVQLSTEQLASIRIASSQGSFYEAMCLYAVAGANESGLAGKQTMDRDLQNKLRVFMALLDGWREEARHGALADLIWNIFRVTGFFDFVAGLPGGQQRQANLRALYDRARQYEATSFRGLFRFLRFVERMKDSGGDLGTARALGEQEDVVRIMSIHKSKGLEFPVVFCAAMSKRFNMRDLTEAFMVHKDLGFGPKFTDAAARISYPTLPWLAIRRKQRMEMIAEEMRVLYVALTRAREKLYIVATIKGSDKLLHQWSRYVEHDRMLLPDAAVASARSYMDWIGPAIMRHPSGALLRNQAGITSHPSDILNQDTSLWQVHLIKPESAAALFQAAVSAAVDAQLKQAVLGLEHIEEGQYWEFEVTHKLAWKYPEAQSSSLPTKISVTELKRQSEHVQLLEKESGETILPDKAEMVSPVYQPVIVRRPRFMEQKKMNAVERGTVFHAVMQHIPITHEPSVQDVLATLDDMVHRELITMEQSRVVEPEVISAFFRSDVGQRLLQSTEVYREIPFSFGMPANEAYADSDLSDSLSSDIVLLQGMIDCLFVESDGLVLIDFKTDRVPDGGDTSAELIKERHRKQIELYANAVETIWKRPVKGKYIFLFDGARLLEL